MPFGVSRWVSAFGQQRRREFAVRQRDALRQFEPLMLRGLQGIERDAAQTSQQIGSAGQSAIERFFGDRGPPRPAAPDFRPPLRPLEESPLRQAAGPPLRARAREAVITAPAVERLRERGAGAGRETLFEAAGLRNVPEASVRTLRADPEIVRMRGMLRDPSLSQEDTAFIEEAIANRMRRVGQRGQARGAAISPTTAPDALTEAATTQAAADPKLQRLRSQLSDPKLNRAEREFIQSAIAELELSARGRAAEELSPPRVTGERIVSEALKLPEREVEFFRPATEPVGRTIGGALAETAVLPAQPLRIAGEELGIPGLGAIPSRQEAREAVEPVAGEIAAQGIVPSTFVTIPVVDPAVAKLLGIVGRVGARVARPVLERLAARAAEKATQAGLRETERAAFREAEVALRDAAAGRAAQGAPLETEAVRRGVEVPPAAVPEAATGEGESAAAARRLLAKAEPEAAPLPPREPTVKRLDLEGREIAEAAPELPARLGLPEPDELPAMAGGNPVQRMVELIQEAKPARAATRLLRKREMARRAAILRAGLDVSHTGEEAQRRALGALRGQMPTADFNPVRGLLAPDEIDDLKIMIRDYYRPRPRESLSSVPTFVALDKILDGGLPTPSELRLLENVFGRELSQALLQKRPLGAKVSEELFAALSLWRTFITGGEQSIVFRQAFIPSINPLNARMTGRNVARSLRAGVSNEATLGIHEAWMKTPEWERLDDAAKRAGYRLFTKWEGAADPLAREENFTLLERTMVGRIAMATPLLGQYLNFSNRSAVTFLNGTRLELGSKYLRTVDNLVASGSDDDIARLAQRYGVDLTDQAGQPIASGELREIVQSAGEEDVARVMAVFSGRGRIPAGDVAQIASRALFSAQLQASRIQTPFLLLTKNPAVRKLVARDIATALGMGLSLLGMAKYSGIADVELDPRSTDFAKIKIGAQRIDPWAGFQQYARLIAQTASGKRKVALGDFQKMNRWEGFLDFWDNKLAPGPGLVADILRGETVIGEKLQPTLGTVKREAFNRMLPLMTQDVIDALREQGTIAGLIAAPLAWFGVGAQTYTPRSIKTAEMIGEDLQQGRLTSIYEEVPLRIGDLTPSDQERFRTLHPEIAKEAAERLQESERGKFTAQRVEELGLADLAARIEGGEEQLKLGFQEAYQELRGERALVSQLEFGGIEFPEPNTEAGRLLDEYFALRPEQFRDETTGVVEWERFFGAQDDVLRELKKLDPDAATAIVSRPILDALGDPALAQVEAEALEARKLRAELTHEVQQYKGVSREQQRELDTLIRDASEQRDEAKRQLGSEGVVSVADAIRLVGRNQNKPDSFIEDAVAYQKPAVRQQLLTNEYAAFLYEHEGELRLFYPYLYTDYIDDYIRWRRSRSPASKTR